jgi:hypothetical protein
MKFYETSKNNFPQFHPCYKCKPEYNFILYISSHLSHIIYAEHEDYGTKERHAKF